MKISHNFEFNVLVKDRPIKEYLHEGITFVEGRKGSEFQLQLANTSGSRVLVVPSVDGLSTFDGSAASYESKGYIVNAYTKLSVPGWTLNNKEIAKFVFQDKPNSYAQSTPTGATNVGVIGLLIYSEKLLNYNLLYPTTYTYPYALRGVQQHSAIGNVGLQPAEPSYGAYASCSNTSVDSLNITVNSSQPLGTGFGDKHTFHTQIANFERGTLLFSPVIYYDTFKNLVRRGVPVTREQTQPVLPQAFPSQGCTPPQGWTG